MKLRTQCYLLEPSPDPVDSTIGLSDLRKGLNRVLLGYLLSIGAIGTACGFVWYLVSQGGSSLLSRTSKGNVSTVLFGAYLLFGLVASGSLTLIVRGKWMCLSSAPEHFRAKWMMFLSILCILAGPVLNFAVYLVDDSKSQVRNRTDTIQSIIHPQQALETYTEQMSELDARTSIQLAGRAIGMLSSIFFALFLRAVALCWNAPIRARFTELYLVFVALLAFGVFILIRNPDYMLARPRLLLALAAGWLLSGLWYFGLILSMSAGASVMLARRSQQVE